MQQELSHSTAARTVVLLVVSSASNVASIYLFLRCAPQGVRALHPSSIFCLFRRVLSKPITMLGSSIPCIRWTDSVNRNAFSTFSAGHLHYYQGVRVTRTNSWKSIFNHSLMKCGKIDVEGDTPHGWGAVHYTQMVHMHCDFAAVTDE